MMNDLNKQMTDAPAGPSVPEGLQFTEDFEWVRLGGRVARIGLTDQGQARFVQIEKVELPKPGAPVKCGDAVGTVHCATGANPVTTPLSGTISEINERGGRQVFRSIGFQSVIQIHPRREPPRPS